MCRLSCRSRFLSSRPLTFKFLVVWGVVEQIFKVSSQDRVQQLVVGTMVEVCKVFPQDRVLHSFVEQISWSSKQCPRTGFSSASWSSFSRALSQDRVQQRFVGQIFMKIFKALSRDRVQLLVVEVFTVVSLVELIIAPLHHAGRLSPRRH